MLQITSNFLKIKCTAVFRFIRASESDVTAVFIYFFFFWCSISVSTPSMVTAHAVESLRLRESIIHGGKLKADSQRVVCWSDCDWDCDVRQKNVKVCRRAWDAHEAWSWWRADSFHTFPFNCFIYTKVIFFFRRICSSQSSRVSQTHKNQVHSFKAFPVFVSLFLIEKRP